MSTITHDDLLLCTVCTMLVANGEYNDGTDAGEIATTAMAERWAGSYLVVTCADDEECIPFTSHECDGCGSSLAGERHTAVAFAR